MKKLLLIAGYLLGITTLTAQIVNIPDANFKAYLVGNVSINTNMDTEIQLSEANAFNGTINVFNQNINDLTGIESFTALSQLNCYDNNLNTLDVSNNTALTLLSCGDNNLTSLDVSSNVNLTTLICSFNDITSLDVSNNVALDLFWCNVNQLTAIDVSMLPLLASFSVASNSLTTLDVSANSVLADLTCQTNNLTSLNVANGNNTNFTAFSAILNPALTCIQVDDSLYSATNWTSIDAASSFNENCLGGCIVNIPDASFKSQLLFNVSINTNADAEIQCTEASAYTGTINVSSSSISDLTGIEAFTSLTNLNCSGNLLTSLNVSSNTALTNLDCTLNSLTSLNVSNNAALIILGCNQNQITSLDVSANTNLTTLSCSNNYLTSLNVANSTALTTLNCGYNYLTALDVSNNTSLITLYCWYNQLTMLNAKNTNNTNFTNFNAVVNPSLTCIQVDNAAYSTTNWPSIDVTASFSENCNYGIENNQLTSVSLYPNPATDFITIELDETFNNAKVEILNALGQVVSNQPINSNITTLQLPVQNGIYFIKLTVDHKTKTERLLVAGY